MKYNERVLCVISASLLVAMMVVPLLSFEAWSAIDAARVDKPVHICEVCGSEVSG